MSNLVAMRKAGQSGATVNKAAIEILKGVTDEAVISALRYEYVVGYVMADDTDAKVAIDYLPAQDAKPGTKGKWQPFPVNEPTTFDATVHRPLVIHNRYRAALTAWSQVRASAGLASLGGKREPRVQTPNGKVTPTGLANLAIETGLDAAKIIEHVKGFDTWLGHTLKANAKALRGDAGEALRKVEADLHAYVADLAEALARDATPSPTVSEARDEARDAELEASRKAMADMKAELEAMKASAAKPKAVKLAKAA